MRINIKNILLITVVLLSQWVSAQMYVGVQSGIANLESDVEGTLSESRLGGAIKLGYIHKISSHFGIGTGVELAQYQQEVTLSNTPTLTNFEVDLTTSAFVYKVTALGYKEKQTLQAVQVPLFLQYKKRIKRGVEFNFRAGTKWFLPVNYKINAQANSVNGEGYYPDFDLNIANLPEYGFGVQNNYVATGSYQTKAIWMSMFELNFTFDVNAKNSLYVGLVLENSYNSIINQEKKESFIGYNPTSVTDRKANGLYSIDANAKVKPFAFGLTLGWILKSKGR